MIDWTWDFDGIKMFFLCVLVAAAVPNLDMVESVDDKKVSFEVL